MSDSAFANHPYPSYTTKDLIALIRDTPSNTLMANEIIRRNFRAMGDMSIMSAGERLSYIRATR